MRTRATAIATTGVALLISACGGGTSSSSTSSTSAHATGAVAFSECMRSHGVSAFPDPDSSGNVPKAKVIPLVSSPQFPAAQRSCHHLLPNTPRPTSTHAEVQAALSGMVRFAACMRSHGVQEWPDPIVDRSRPGDPRPVFDLHSSVDPSAPQIVTDVRDCDHVMPGSTSPYFCSRLLAQRIPGSPPDAEACAGGSPAVP
jgi:hypothetical protein